ncbi:VOC family protein [Marivirga sp. S37H4]|uniref:VOC family protein n=1 Tax=Marivirga aurantiaca TaxID=2802615 RepID=A0A934X037_9BACT|nr:VOC family protein [Marivirga aurantiaca]MBK6266423.1 VOC family protein [Marivirga aurantiaca]
MYFTQIKETCLYIKDLERAKSFYHGKLELPIIAYVPDKLIFFRSGTSVLLCFNPEYSKEQEVPPPHFALGKQHIAFEVKAEEYESAKKELYEKGIMITYEHQWPTGKRSAYFEDPEGHVLEIVPSGLWDE